MNFVGKVFQCHIDGHVILVLNQRDYANYWCRPLFPRFLPKVRQFVGIEQLTKYWTEL